MIKKELIGLKVKVISSGNKTLIGLQGRVIDETKNTISIETEEKVRKVLKKDVTLELLTKKGRAVIKGKELIGKPLDRLKRKESKKRW